MKSKVIKHREALARQDIYNKLSLGDKIKRAESRRGESKREIAHLKNLQQKEKKS
jgi:hypothetical protein